MSSDVLNTSWVEGNNPAVLQEIHRTQVNIAIYNRNLNEMRKELELLSKEMIEFRSSGDLLSIFSDIENAGELAPFESIREDLKKLLRLFSDVSEADIFRVFFAVVTTNMCRKFHADINDLRMLCTYRGPGTLWVAEDLEEAQIKREKLVDDPSSIDTNRIHKAQPGDVLLMKGAIYPKEGFIPVLHRSPILEGDESTRILLRIDTDQFANFS
ncbi:MAG: DUF1826 domain-containing protein [Bacteroidota bacterium]